LNSGELAEITKMWGTAGAQARGGPKPELSAVDDQEATRVADAWRREIERVALAIERCPTDAKPGQEDTCGLLSVLKKKMEGWQDGGLGSSDASGISLDGYPVWRDKQRGSWDHRGRCTGICCTELCFDEKLHRNLPPGFTWTRRQQHAATTAVWDILAWRIFAGSVAVARVADSVAVRAQAAAGTVLEQSMRKLVVSDTPPNMQCTDEADESKWAALDTEFEKWSVDRHAKNEPLKYNLSYTMEIHRCMASSSKPFSNFADARQILLHVLYHIAIGFEHVYIHVYSTPQMASDLELPGQGYLMDLTARGYITWIPLIIPTNFRARAQNKTNHWSDFDGSLKSRGLANTYLKRIKQESKWLAVIDFDEFLFVNTRETQQHKSILDVLTEVDSRIPNVCMSSVVGRAPHTNGVSHSDDKHRGLLRKNYSALEYFDRAEICPMVSSYSQGDDGDGAWSVKDLLNASKFNPKVDQDVCFKTIYRTEGQKHLDSRYNMHNVIAPEPGYLAALTPISTIAVMHMQGFSQNCPYSAVRTHALTMQLSASLYNGIALPPDIWQALTLEHWDDQTF
jgi:hypothetical protein